MSDTEIKFELYYDDDSQILVGVFDSEMLAKKYATETRETEAQKYKIVSRITTRSVLDAFTVPAYVKSLEEIAEEIISDSDGSFNVEWGEEYSALSIEDQSKIDSLVWDAIASCGHCGWHWHVDNLESHELSSEPVCHHCQDLLDMELEEQEEDED